MILKKNFSLLIIFFIISIQIFLYINNNQKTSFKYFNWTIQEISLGKLISISFFSGFLVSTILNITTTSHKRITLEDVGEKNETLNNEEEVKSTVEMPPQRDIRDAQPTISVNYRVVKNNEGNNLKRDKNYSNIPDNNNDWDCEENDW